MIIQKSAEDYLEMILILGQRLGEVHSIDIANELDYSKPSVSIAMKKLREGGYINVDSNGRITLLETGRAIAEKMYERHIFISKWLMNMGVPEKVALDDACKMEHVISNESFDALKKHIERETKYSK